MTLKPLGVAALSVSLVLVAAVYWLFYENALPSSGTFDLNLDRIRATASSMRVPIALRSRRFLTPLCQKSGSSQGRAGGRST